MGVGTLNKVTKSSVAAAPQSGRRATETKTKTVVQGDTAGAEEVLHAQQQEDRLAARSSISSSGTGEKK